MFVFDSSGQSLAFLDCFGLTRVTLKGKTPKIKNVKEVFGRETATLSLDAAGETLVAWDSGWDRTYCYKFPSVAKKAAFKRFEISESFAHPDGRHIIEARLGRRIDLRVHEARVEGKKTVYAQVASHHPALEGPRLMDGQLGPKAPHAYSSGTWAPFARFAFGPGGRFMLFNAEDSTLMGGRWPDAARPPEVLWRATTRIHQGYRVALYPHPDGDMIWAHDSALERAFGARIVDDAEVTLHEVDALENPVYLGEALALQRDEAHVARVALDGETLEVIDLTALPTLTLDDEALSNAGPGLVMAHAEGPLLFVPWHREGILDLAAGRMIPRKLPEEGRALRRMAMTHRLEYRAFARAAVMSIDVCAVKLTPNKSKSPYYTHEYSFSINLDATKGGLNLLSAFAASHAYNITNRADYEALRPELIATSWGGISFYDINHRVEVEEVAEALQHVAAHGLSLMTCVSELREYFERHLDGGTQWYGIDHHEAMTPDAARLLLNGLIAVTEANGDTACYADLEAWRAAPLDAEAALEGLSRFYSDAHTGSRPYFYSEVYLGLAEVALGEGFLGVLQGLMRDIGLQDLALHGYYKSLMLPWRRYLEAHPGRRAELEGWYAGLEPPIESHSAAHRGLWSKLGALLAGEAVEG